MCAFVESDRHFCLHQYKSKFTCTVDHHSLLWLTNLKNPTDTLAGWLERLAEYQFSVIHHPGRLHSNADELSGLQQNNNHQDKNAEPIQNKLHQQITVAALTNQALSISTQKIIDKQQIDPLIHQVYKKGDQVWPMNMKSDINKPAKLALHYSGPYKILKVLDFDTYIIEMKNG